MDRIQFSSALCCRNDCIDLPDPPVSLPDCLPESLFFTPDIGKADLQILHCQDIVLFHVIDNCHKAFKVLKVCFVCRIPIAPGQESLICTLVKFLFQQIDQIDLLRLHFNFFNCLPDISKPGRELQDRILQESDHFIYCADFSVQISDICPDSLSLQGHSRGSHMHCRDYIDSLPFIRLHADTLCPPRAFQILVLQFFPVMPPHLCIAARIPVHSRNLPNLVFSVWAADPVPVFVQYIFLVCFRSPVSIFIQWTHSQQDMEMGVVIWRIWIMNSQVCDHPFGNKFLLAVFSDERNVVFHGQFDRKRDLHSPGKLRVPVRLRRLC